MPINSWFAVYNNDDGHGPVAKTLSCLALIEDVDGTQKIVGFDGGEKFIRSDVQENFLGYYHEEELRNMLVEEIDE